MVSGESVSRWVMYFGLLALAGTAMNGIASYPASFTVALLLFLQYPALQLYRGYNSTDTSSTDADV